MIIDIVYDLDKDWFRIFTLERGHLLNCTI